MTLLKVLACAMLALALGSAAQAGATHLDFDDGTDFLPIGSFYADQGAVFTDARWHPCYSVRGCSSPYEMVTGLTNGQVFWVSFTGPQDWVSFTNLSYSGILATAFDANGQWLAEMSNVQLQEIQPGTNLVTLMGTGIAKVRFTGAGWWQDAGIPQFGIDDLSFGAVTPAPEPEVWVLMLAGLAAAGAALRRRPRPSA